MTTNLEKMTFGQAVRHYRKEREWVQSELAERAGVPAPNISALEMGRYIPSFKTGVQIIAALVGDEGQLKEFRAEVARITDGVENLAGPVKRATRKFGLTKTDFGVLVNKLAEVIDDPPGGRSYKKFGMLLKDALDAASLSQSELSRILQRGRSQRGNTKLVSAWCDGRQAPSADLMREVVKVLRDKIPRDKVEDLRRARWADMFMADTRFDDMTKAERKAATDFLSDLDT